jgi:hypothetical protein
MNWCAVQGFDTSSASHALIMGIIEIVFRGWAQDVSRLCYGLWAKYGSYEGESLQSLLVGTLAAAAFGSHVIQVTLAETEIESEGIFVPAIPLLR